MQHAQVSLLSQKSPPLFPCPPLVTSLYIPPILTQISQNESILTLQNPLPLPSVPGFLLLDLDLRYYPLACYAFPTSLPH